MRDETVTALRAARAGGAILRGYFGQELVVRQKQGADIVTEADLAAEAAILAVLQTAHPDVGVVSEERGATATGSAYTWVVDPLDGTNNFVLDIPQFGVSIALLHDDETILGVVYQPMADILWHAERGAGARRNGVALSTRPADNLDRAAVAYVQGYLADDMSLAVQQALRGRVKRILTNWAPALDWCLLAEGKIAALVSLDSEREDQLAGTLIAREAGCLVTDLRGRSPAPHETRLLAIGNAPLHASLLPLLASVAG